MVDYEEIAYSPAPPPIDPLVRETVEWRTLRRMSADERRKVQQDRRYAERHSFEEVRLWWLERMIESPRPFEEVMTLFWHGHFTSGMREVKRAVFLYEQNQLLREHALGDFGEFVQAISKNRAMLAYLDGNRNIRRQPNENYARELLELFTLGVGNYEEADIQAAARAFTGWSYDDKGYVFRARHHDSAGKDFLGRHGTFDGDDIVKIILDQRECSEFLARTLLEYFLRPDPSEDLIKGLARLIRTKHYDLKRVMRVLLTSRAFYHSEARGALVKSPVGLLVGACRELDTRIENLALAERALVGMGQEIMQPPNVKGWDGGEKWITTATLFNRYNTLGALINGVAPQGAARRMLARAGEETHRYVDEIAQSRINTQIQPPYHPRRLLYGRGVNTAAEGGGLSRRAFSGPAVVAWEARGAGGISGRPGG